MPRVTVAPHTPALGADFNAVADQSVMRFPTAAARTTAIPTPTKGMTTYRDDANAVETWDGATWVLTSQATAPMFATGTTTAYGLSFVTVPGATLDVPAGRWLLLATGFVEWSLSNSITNSAQIWDGTEVQLVRSANAVTGQMSIPLSGLKTYATTTTVVVQAKLDASVSGGSIAIRVNLSAVPV